MVSLEYLWTLSEKDVNQLLLKNGKRKTQNSKLNRLVLTKLYREQFSEEDQMIVNNPAFDKTIMTLGYFETITKLSSTSLDEIWQLDVVQLTRLLKYLIPDITDIDPKQLDYYKLMLAKAYKKQGQLSDAALLDLPGSNDLILRYGLDVAKERLVSRNVISEHFNELALASTLDEYYFQPRYLYMTTHDNIMVINPATHKVMRTIPYAEPMSRIIGCYNDNLYVSLWVDGHYEIYTISLSLPTIYNKIMPDVAGVHMYKNLLCYQPEEDGPFEVLDLDTNEVIRSFPKLEDYYSRKDRFIADGTTTLYDLETDVVQQLLPEYSFIGNVDNKLVLYKDTDSKKGSLILQDPATNEIIENKSNFRVNTINNQNRVEYQGKIYLLCDDFDQHLAGNIKQDANYWIQVYDAVTLKTLESVYQSKFRLAGLYIDEENHQLIFIEQLTYDKEQRLIFLSLLDYSISTIDFQGKYIYDEHGFILY